jgi:flagellar protein FlaG
MIIFIASILVAAAVAGVFIDTVGGLSQAIEQQGVANERQVETDIEIISDAGSQIYDRDGNNNITLLVKNTGSRDLDAAARELDVIVNGSYISAVGVTAIDGDAWETDSVVRVEIDTALDADTDHRVKLIANGDEEVFRFRT